MKTKNSIFTKLILGAGLVAGLSFACGCATNASSGEQMKPMKGGERQMMRNSPNTPAEGKEMMTGQMTDSCKDMMQQKKKMMEEMKAQDIALTEQVAQMNRAPENQKSTLMAAIVTKMVEQRTAGNAKMEKMQAKMMQHMMQHMQMGKESMAQCPMMKGMKGMKGMDEKSGDAHKEDQEK